MPPKALTTTMTGWCRASFSTIFFRLRILETEPTDVPPNFNTFIADVFWVIIRLPLMMEKMPDLGAKITRNIPIANVFLDIFD